MTDEAMLAAAAHAYAETGTAIIPLWWPAAVDCCACPAGTSCVSPGKHPLTVNGVKDATTDAVTVTVWWRRWPTANIGIAMTDTVFVVDIDPHNDGETTWAELMEAHASLSTRTSISGRGDGGRHLWLSHPGVTLKGRLGPGVDIKRPPNAYVVAPPSIHAATLQPYRWIGVQTPIADPPSWLVDQLRERPRPPRGSHVTACSFGRWNPGGLLHAVAHAVEGNRNHTLFWAAARIGDDVAAGKVNEHQALDVLDVLAEIAESTGLSTLEVDRTIRSGYRR